MRTRLAVTSAAASPLRLRLLDVELAVHVDDLRLRRGLATTYSRFAGSAGVAPDLELTLSRSDHGAILLTPEGNLVAPRGSEASLYFALLTAVLKRVRGHFVFHAGVVEHAGRALVLAAPSGVGKTTLTLALVASGCGFLSDELAPVRRSDFSVDPYPRAVGLRADTASLWPDWAAARGPRTREADGTAKRFVDLGAKTVDPLAGPLPPSHVILLTPRPDPELAGRPCLELSLSRLTPRLARDLGDLAGVRASETLLRRGGPVLRLVLEPGARVTRAVDERVAAAGSFVTAHVPFATAVPDFEAEPVLTELTPSAGLLGLARHLLNGREAGAEAELGRTLFELAGLAARVRFAALAVGRLETMVERVRAFSGAAP